MANPAPPQPAADLTGHRVGDYQLLRPLGRGATGDVYLAVQLSLKREVALKILRTDHAADPTALKRFQAEAEAVARVPHPNIVQVFAVGEEDGVRFIALEYVEGRNLRDYLARKGAPDLPLALSVLRQVAAALQRAGEAGLVHRDIKPENILLTRKAEVKVADFGLSRDSGGPPPGADAVSLTQPGVALGTPLYMSPEQVQGLPADHRSDLYSFGVTAYHLLAGRPPFAGTTPFGVAVQHVQATPPPLADRRPDLPPALCDLVHRLLAKNPEARYQTARDVLLDLAKVQKGLPIGPPPRVEITTELPAVTVPPPVTKPWRGRALGVVALALLAVAGWLLAGRPQPTPDAVAGLPTARLPVPVTSERERELTARSRDRAAKPAEYLAAAVELGVLYLREGRPDDAERVFKELAPDRPGRTEAALAARLGLAAVLSRRDRPKESNQAMTDAVTAGGRASQATLDELLLRHPELAEAVADALQRNADALGTPTLPPAIEWLRTPGGLLRGPRG
jgi:tRNA A-37 threonylcarbamoyl transferase component Bud32